LLSLARRGRGGNAAQQKLLAHQAFAVKTVWLHVAIQS